MIPEGGKGFVKENKIGDLFIGGGRDEFLELQIFKYLDLIELQDYKIDFQKIT